MNYSALLSLCRRAPLAAALLAALPCAGALAGVTNFDVFCSNYYFQSSHNEPTVPLYYTFSLRVTTESAKDYHAFHVTLPGPVGTAQLEKDSDRFVYFSTYHRDAALRDVDYPAGTLEFVAVGGPNGSEMARCAYSGANHFAPTPPKFVNVDDFKNVDTARDLPIVPTYFTIPPGVDYTRTFIQVYDEMGAMIDQADVAPNSSALVIPARTLRPDSRYTIALFFSSRQTRLGAGFGGASSQVAWDSITLASITTIPGCGSTDFNCDGDVGTDADIEAFFACLAGRCPPPPCMSTTDFDGDGDVGTDADIEAFFRVLAGGSC